MSTAKDRLSLAAEAVPVAPPLQGALSLLDGHLLGMAHRCLRCPPGHSLRWSLK